MATRVNSDMTDGVVKTAEKASKSPSNNAASDEGKIVQLNSSGKIPTAYYDAGTSNTPNFKVRAGTGQVIPTATDTVMVFATSVFDTGSDWDGTNHRYIPGTAGTYFLHASVRLDEDATFDRFILQVRKNGTVVSVSDVDYNDLTTNQVIGLATANGSGDYFDVVISQNSGSNKTTANQEAYTFFEGFRLT